MSTSLSDLPLPGGQQMPQQMDMGGQQQFDLNKMIDVAAQASQQPTYQNDSNISSGALQYQLDQSQIPQNGPTPNIQMQEQQYEGDMGMEPQYQYDMMEPEQEPSFFEKIMKDMKFAGIVAVLFVALSLPQFNKLLTGFIPKFLAETGEINMMGIAAKALILAILFLSLRFVL
jgi:hypothetical protein